MTEDQIYIDKAREELLNPTFELTKQHLAVMQVQLEDGLPAVARVNLNQAENTATVYFRVLNERFFIVIHLSKSPEIKVEWFWIVSGHRVYLTATSQELSYNELKEGLNLNPLKGWSKGDWRPKNHSQYTFSRISYEPIRNEAYDLEEKLTLLLNEIEKDWDAVVRLSKVAHAQIAIVKNQYVSGNAGIHLDVQTITRLQKLNLELDIDTYIGGEALNSGL